MRVFLTTIASNLGSALILVKLSSKVTIFTAPGSMWRRAWKLWPIRGAFVFPAVYLTKFEAFSTSGGLGTLPDMQLTGEQVRAALTALMEEIETGNAVPTVQSEHTLGGLGDGVMVYAVVTSEVGDEESPTS